MFQFLKRSIDLYAPVVGKTVSLSNVPDEVFANKLLGDGVAFQFDTDTIFAPCDCEIIMIANTKHAIGLRAKNKAEIMIHIGLDTVNFNGEGFEVYVSCGDNVKKGQPLVKINRAFFEKHQVNLITPMIVTSKDYKLQLNHMGEGEEKFVIRIE